MSDIKVFQETGLVSPMHEDYPTRDRQHPSSILPSPNSLHIHGRLLELSLVAL
jgi:hypothetical protein